MQRLLVARPEGHPCQKTTRLLRYFESKEDLRNHPLPSQHANTRPRLQFFIPVD